MFSELNNFTSIHLASVLVHVLNVPSPPTLCQSLSLQLLGAASPVNHMSMMLADLYNESILAAYKHKHKHKHIINIWIVCIIAICRCSSYCTVPSPTPPLLFSSSLLSASCNELSTAPLHGFSSGRVKSASTALRRK